MTTESEWAGFMRGDPVKVKGFRGQWKFHSVTRDSNGTATSVCVIGGPSGRSAFRHFYPDRLEKVKVKNVKAK